MPPPSSERLSVQAAPDTAASMVSAYSWSAAAEQALTRFLEGTIPDLSPSSLAPYDEAARLHGSQPGPSLLLQRLRERTRKADALCRQYERDLNIYAQAEDLPEAERRAQSQSARLKSAQDLLATDETALAPLATLNSQRQQAGLPEITLHTLARFSAQAGWLRHHWCRFFLPDYRRAVACLQQIGQHEGLSVAALLARRDRRRQELVVLDMQADLALEALRRQRALVQAYVENWASRLSEADLLREIRQAMADMMLDPRFRATIARRFDKRYTLLLAPVFEPREKVT